MSSIRVVDVNNEDAKQEVEVAPVIEEAKEEVKEAVIEEVQQDIKNEVVEQTKEEPKAEAKAEAKVKAQDRLITCPKCKKTMKTKSYRYNHEKICQGNLTDRPVKPKAKATPKPEPIQEQIQEPIQEPIIEQPVAQPKPQQHPPPSVKSPTVPAINPLMSRMPREASAAASHYQLLQQQYMQQKQERFNNLFQGMISGSRKKR